MLSLKKSLVEDACIYDAPGAANAVSFASTANETIRVVDIELLPTLRSRELPPSQSFFLRGLRLLDTILGSFDNGFDRSRPRES